MIALLFVLYFSRIKSSLIVFLDLCGEIAIR